MLSAIKSLGEESKYSIYQTSNCHTRQQWDDVLFSFNFIFEIYFTVASQFIYKCVQMVEFNHICKSEWIGSILIGITDENMKTEFFSRARAVVSAD